MSEPSDWEPLTEAQRTSNPGESANVPLRPRAPARPAVDPAAERALQELQRRLREAPASQSLVADLTHREARQHRRQRAAQAPSLAACKPVVSSVQEKDLPLELQYDPGTAGRDVREEQLWFAALPEAERARLHDQWAAERGRFACAGLLRRRQLLRAAGHGALVCFVVAVLQSFLIGHFGLVPLLTGVGGLAAAVVCACRGDRFAYAAAGAAVFMAILAPTILVNPHALYGVVLGAYGMGALGMEDEMRRSGGFDPP